MPGWSLFTDAIRDVILWLTGVVGNPGVAIIIITLVIKTALTPLTLPALRNGRRQAELAPLVKEIQKKHGKDRAAATAEQMELYKQYGFNPMSGCLPMLVQAPIWFALWQGIMKLQGYKLGGFLWIKDIADPDIVLGFLPLLPILAALAQFVQTRMSMMPASERQGLDPQQQQMNRIMQFFPLMVIFFGLNVSAGAVLYWLFSSIYSAVLQFFVSGWGSLRDLLPFLPATKAKSYLPPPKPEGYGGGSGRGGFLQRFQERMLEEQQKQQAQQGQKKQDGQQGQDPRGTAATIAPTKQTARRESSAATATLVAEPDTDGEVRYTEDAWRLPGAPGSTGSVAAVGGAAASAAQATSSNGTAGQPRNGAKRRKRKR